jgi:hypothetical protein
MPLPIYNLSILDNSPRAASGAMVYVYNQPTTGITAPTFDGMGNIVPGSWTDAATPLASIYSDNAGSDPLPNPFMLDGNANGWFYAVDGLYTVVVTGSTLNAPLILVDQSLISASGSGTVFQTNGSANPNQALLNLVQGSNITLAVSGGNVTISGTAAGVAFKNNGTNNSSQTVLNLVSGTGITLTDGGGGAITIASTGGVTFKVNGTPNADQTLLNLFDGANITVTDAGSGKVTIASGYPIFQANSTPLTSSGTINFQQGSGVVITNPSAGTVNIAVASSFQPVLQQATVLISSAQLLALRATPVSLIVAQGSSSVIVVDSVVLEFIPDTTPYSTVSTADLAVYVDTTKATTFTGDSTALIDQSAKTFEILSPTAAKFFTTDAHSDNTACFIANVSGAEYTAGNGTLNVTVNYYVVQVV